MRKTERERVILRWERERKKGRKEERKTELEPERERERVTERTRRGSNTSSVCE